MSKVPYDKHYQKEHYFGESYTGLISFFQDFDRSMKVLDIGCGQGRDALMLGRLGYEVLGIDISQVGIDQMNAQAQAEGLNVNGIVADLKSYKIDDSVDLVLTDSMLHFYQNDRDDEVAFVKMLLSQLKVGACWCNCIVSGSGREDLVRKLVQEHKYNYELLADFMTPYPDYGADYHVIVAKRRHCLPKD